MQILHLSISTDTNKNSQINDSVYIQSEISQLINCEFFTHSYIRSKILQLVNREVLLYIYINYTDTNLALNYFLNCEISVCL